FGGGEPGPVPRPPLEPPAESGNAPREFGHARPTRAHPAVGDRRSALDRVGMPAAEPDRRMRLLHRLGRHAAALELIDAAAEVDLRLGPQRLDQLDLLEKSP